MDSPHTYARPASNRWMKLLFLTTGFIIGAMCLWAFAEKQMSRQAPNPVALPQSPTPHIPAPRIALEADLPELQRQSPARSAMEASRIEISAPATNAPQTAAFEQPTTYPMSVSPYSETVPGAATEVPVSSTGQHQHDTVIETYPSDRPPIATSPSREASNSEHVQLNQEQSSFPNSVEALANDSFWNISDRIYGDPRFYKALFEHNRNWIAYPDRIEQGFRVMTPTISELRQRYPALCP